MDAQRLEHLAQRLEQLEQLIKDVHAIRETVELLRNRYGLHPLTYVRCSCGLSGITWWSEDVRSYEGPPGWKFSLDTNGWTCGREGHTQAEAHYV